MYFTLGKTLVIMKRKQAKTTHVKRNGSVQNTPLNTKHAGVKKEKRYRERKEIVLE